MCELNKASSLRIKLLERIEIGDTVMVELYIFSVIHELLKQQGMNAKLFLKIICSIEILQRIKAVPSAMSTRTLPRLTSIIHMDIVSYLIVLSKTKMLQIRIPIRTTRQHMAQILPLYLLTTNMYSSKMEKSTARKRLTK